MEKAKTETMTTNENEIRITAQNRMRNYIPMPLIFWILTSVYDFKAKRASFVTALEEGTGFQAMEVRVAANAAARLRDAVTSGLPQARVEIATKLSKMSRLCSKLRQTI